MNGAIEFWNRAAAAWWDWTVTTTWHGALLLMLIALVLVVMKSLRPGIRYGLLLVVLLKLAMPPVLRLSYGFSDLLAQMTAVPVTPAKSTSVNLMVGPGTQDALEGVQAAGVLQVPMAVPEFSAWILLLQLFGAAALGALILRHVLVTWKIKRATAQAGSVLQTQLAKVAVHMGLGRVPALYVSPQVSGPQSGGILRPFILLPEWAATMSASEREILLAHEVAHVLRRDALVNGFQALTQALLWWNPLVWWVNRRIREEREYCCDDLVVARGVAHGQAYARTLLDVAERVATPRSSWAMVGMADAYHVLDRRVRRALNEPRTVWPGARYVGLVAMALFAGWILPGSSDGVEEVVTTGAIASTTGTESEAETLNLDTGKERTFSEDGLWVQRSYRGAAFYEKVDADIAAQERLQVIRSADDQVIHVTEELNEATGEATKDTIKIRAWVVRVEAGVDIRLPNPRMHVSEDLSAEAQREQTADGHFVHQPFIAGRANAEEWETCRAEILKLIESGRATTLGRLGMVVRSGEGSSITTRSNNNDEKSGETGDETVELTLGILAKRMEVEGGDDEVSLQLQYSRSSQVGKDGPDAVITSRGAKSTLILEDGGWGYFYLNGSELVAFEVNIVPAKNGA